MVEIPEGFPFRIWDTPMIVPADEILDGWRVKYYSSRRGEKYPDTEWIKHPEIFSSKDECIEFAIKLVTNNPDIHRLVLKAYEKGIQYSIIDGFREQT